MNTRKGPIDGNGTIVRTSGRLLAVAVVLLILGAVTVRMTGVGASAPGYEIPAQLSGLTLRYALKEGEHVERSFVDDSRADWKMLSGPRMGDQGSEILQVKSIAPGIFFVNRVDPVSRETLSEVYNLATRTVASYATRPNPDDPMSRLESYGEGVIEIVDKPAAAESVAASP